ncbi:MAG: PIN domain-containing protein [Pseudonocardiales bacterium]
MTVLDAYAVISFLRDEPAADEVATLLRGPTLLPSVNQAEVIDQLVRVYHRAADDVDADLALLSHAGMDIAMLDAATATLAGRLRARHYHRERCAVSLADCVASATAIMHGRPLATADPALAAVLRAEHGKIIGLPDTNGQRP